MSHYLAILDDRPDRIGRLRFLLHLREIQALLSMDAAEVMNWKSTCRQINSDLRGVILHAEPENRKHLEALVAAGFELPVYVIRGQWPFPLEGLERLQLFVGTVDQVLSQLPAKQKSSVLGFATTSLGARA